MKKPEMVLRECVIRSSDETLKFLGGRLSQRLGGDIPEALEALSEMSEVDRLLSSARSAWDIFDVLDIVQDVVEREIRKRNQ